MSSGRRKYSSRGDLSLTPAKTDLTQVKLRHVTDKERREWEATTKDKGLLQHSFWNLEELVEYPFKDGDKVWVRTAEERWLYGKVTGNNIRMGLTRRNKAGYFYTVLFGPRMNTRKYFAPLNGDMKPDTEEVREMLKESGWIDSDDHDDNGSSFTDSSN